jgi:tetratricopeptide (TPR) repeat protein
MKHLSILVLLLACITACKSQNKTPKEISAAATHLHDSALALFRSDPKNNIDAALKLLDKAIATDAGDYTAWGMKSSIYSMQGRDEDALYAAKKVEELNPYMPETPYYEGVLYYNLGKKDSADMALNRAVDLFTKKMDTTVKNSPEYFYTGIQKGVTLKILGREKEGNDLLNTLHNNTKDDNARVNIEMYLNKDRATILKEFAARAKND